jgi:hypothetical protein
VKRLLFIIKYMGGIRMETNLNQQELNEKFGMETRSIGAVTRKEMIEREIIFNAPDKDVVLKVINILNEIEIKDVKATSGNILVTGYLNSCIMYTTMKRPQMESNKQGENNNGEKSSENANNSDKHGYVNMGNNKNNENSNKNKNKEKEKAKPSCGVVDNSIALDGVLRHTTVWIPFKAFIPAEEAQAEDICTVTSSAVVNDLGATSITPIYEDEYDEEETAAIIRSEETTTINRGKKEQKFIKGINNRSLIELTVDIKRYIRK